MADNQFFSFWPCEILDRANKGFFNRRGWWKPGKK